MQVLLSAGAKVNATNNVRAPRAVSVSRACPSVCLRVTSGTPPVSALMTLTLYAPLGPCLVVRMPHPRIPRIIGRRATLRGTLRRALAMRR